MLPLPLHSQDGLFSPAALSPAQELIWRLVHDTDSYRPATNGTSGRERREVLGVALDQPDKGLLRNLIKHHPDTYGRYLNDITIGEPGVFLSCHEKYYTELFDEDGNAIHPESRYVLDKSSLETAISRIETALSVQHSSRIDSIPVFTRRTGIDDFLAEEDIETPLAEFLGNTDLFSGDICILKKRFPSPLSPYGTVFYRFNLADTLLVLGHRCADLTFEPRDSRMRSFYGHLFYDIDNECLQAVSMTTLGDTKVNFVRSITITQRFEKAADHRINLVDETLLCHFEIDKLNLQKWGGVALRRDVTYSEYATHDQPAPTMSDTPNECIDLLAPSHTYTLTENLIKELRHRFGFSLLEGLGGTAYNAYFPSDPLAPKVWFGPALSLLSWNNIEGVRIRPGFVTSPILNSHLMGRGYVAWGTRDHKFKYMAELEYAFNKKDKYFTEFPKRYVRIHSDYDMLPLGQLQPGDGWDDLIESIKHPYHYPFAMQSRQEVAFADEYRGGLSWEAVARRRSITDPRSTYAAEYFPAGGIKQTEFELNLRYAPGEVYQLEVDDRHLVSKDTPVFTLTHTMAYKGVLGSDYDWQRTLFTYKQRIRFHGWGFMDNTVKAGRVWTKDMPVPLLIVPPTTPSTVGKQGLFSDIDPMELVSDRYISWNMTSRTRYILGTIPGIKKLGLREVIGWRALWLSDALLPYPNTPQTPTPQPAPSIQSPATPLPTPTPQSPANWQPVPYVKLIVGVCNIFQIAELDYIRRITHRDVFNTDSDGLQLRLKFKF